MTTILDTSLVTYQDIYGRHGVTIKGYEGNRWFEVRERPLPADYEPRHAEREWGREAYLSRSDDGYGDF